MARPEAEMIIKVENEYITIFQTAMDAMLESGMRDAQEDHDRRMRENDLQNNQTIQEQDDGR